MVKEKRREPLLLRVQVLLDAAYNVGGGAVEIFWRRRLSAG